MFCTLAIALYAALCFTLVPPPPGFAVLTRPTPSLPIARSSCAELAARARASMYVFIDVTRDGRTQLTARKQRMHREYTSVFRACLWHPLGAERRSRFLYSINPGTLCIQPESFTSLHQRRYFLFSLTVSLILNHRELWSPPFEPQTPEYRYVTLSLNKLTLPCTKSN